MDIVVKQEDLDRINKCLRQLASRCGSHAVLLVERSGQLVCHCGNRPPEDSVSLAALAAANYGATAAIAKIVGDEVFTLMFHKGKRENVHFQAFNGNFILVSLFRNNTTLGLVRLHIDREIGELKAILDKVTHH
jgi:predicted regulator of Ras-like GTPase activity (Roadblock/LC7/MglB family)